MKHYKNKSDFLKRMHDIVAKSKHVIIDDEKLKLLATSFPQMKDNAQLFPGYVDSIEIDDMHENMKQAFYMIALNVANQSGCIYKGNNGQTERWQIKGSATKAVDDKMQQMFDDGDLPTWNNPWIEPLHLNAHMAGVPFADARTKIFAEFTTEDAKRVISDILDNACDDKSDYNLTFNHSEILAQNFPVSFWQDPFRKKANLVSIIFEDYARYKGVAVSLDVILPSDYRIPQTLHAAGVLDFSDDVVNDIEQEKPFHEDDEIVSELRSACIVVSEKLSELSGRSIIDIDGFLWRAPKTGEMEMLKDNLRNDKTTPYTSKPFTCYTMHF